MKAEYDMSKAKRGPVIAATGKTRITLYLDNSIVDYFREKAEKHGKGYQTLINEILLDTIQDKRIDSIKTLRRVIREELKVINK
jgi:uncharacterized protein (DUF4415 family)